MKKTIRQIRSTLDKFIELNDRNAMAQKHLEKLIRSLDKAGVEVGKPNWKYNAKGDAFLRIVRPAVNGNPRKFVYVGAKPAKIADAFAAIDRQRQKIGISNELREARMQQYILENAIHESSDHLNRKLDRATGHYILNAVSKSVDLTGGRDQIDIEHIRPVREKA